jgi:hypothetical protein
VAIICNWLKHWFYLSKRFSAVEIVRYQFIFGNLAVSVYQISGMIVAWGGVTGMCGVAS